MNQLRGLKLFVATAALGSIRKASAVEGITPQAASKALAQLEQQLGVRLFHRTTRNISLTDEGRQVLDEAQPALAAIDRALRVARRTKDEIAGPLRIAGPKSSLPALLWPVLNEFCRLHPDIRPDVQFDDRVANWVEDRIDVGFRLGVDAAEGVVVRRLIPVTLLICATPEYLVRFGAPENLGNLALHRCSAFRHPTTRVVMPWFVKVEDQIVPHEVAPALSTNDEATEMNALLDGQVIAQVTSVAAAQFIRTGRLIPILTRHAADNFSIFLYYGTRSAQPARVRAFIDFVVERLTGDATHTLSQKELAAAEAIGRKAHGLKLPLPMVKGS